MPNAEKKLEAGQNEKRSKHVLGLFLWVGFVTVSLCSNFGLIWATDIPSSSTIGEDLNSEEKENLADELLQEGDRHMETKNYDLANVTYESIFLLNPNHLEASKRIDRLKKQMKKEGRSETELVTRVYDAEIDTRVRQYLAEAKQLIADQKWGRARFALEKLLLINPLNEEARKLYRELDQTNEKAA